MNRYVDGFVLPILRKHLDDYQVIVEAAAPIWKDHGALQYWECVGDDFETDCSRPFPDVIEASEDEVVIFAFAIFESREARDTANAGICEDPRMAEIMSKLTESQIVDFSRMAHGGFRELLGV